MLEDQVLDLERIVRSQNEWRLHRTINLIASENAMSARARALLNSDFTHRYAEGHPGARYYMGTDYIDIVETRVREAMEKLFDAKHAEVRRRWRAEGMANKLRLGRQRPVTASTRSRCSFCGRSTHLRCC